MLKKEDYKKKREPWRHKFKNKEAYYVRRARVKRLGIWCKLRFQKI